MKVTVSVEGLKEMDEALGELSKGVARGVLRRVGMKALEPMASTARRLAPDDPNTSVGDLKSKIGVGSKLTARQARLNRRAVKAGADKSFVEVYVGVGSLPQATLQEFGAPQHPAQPFMRPAYDEHKDQVVETIKEDLGAEITKAVERARKRASRLLAKG